MQSTGGYQLAVDPEDVDARRFERLAAAGASSLREGDPERARDVLGEALALWRGPAFGDLAGVGSFAGTPARASVVLKRLTSPSASIAYSIFSSLKARRQHRRRPSHRAHAALTRHASGDTAV